MRKIIYYTEIACVIAVIWIILHERISPLLFLSGWVLGILSMVITDRYLLLGDYKSSYQISLRLMLKYLLFLLVQIYRSGFEAILRMLQGKTDVGIVEFETKLENELHICLLANSITLTPGTVTLDKNGRRLKVLCLNRPVSAAAWASIANSFEQILLGR